MRHIPFRAHCKRKGKVSRCCCPRSTMFHINAAKLALFGKSLMFHFGLVTFRIHFRKTRQPICFTVFGFGGRVHDYRNQLFLSLETPGSSTNIKQNTKELPRNIFGNINNWTSTFQKCGTDGGSNKSEEPLNKFLKFLNMRSISTKNMKLQFLKILNTGSISIEKHEMISWIFETSKLRNFEIGKL